MQNKRGKRYLCTRGHIWVYLIFCYGNKSIKATIMSDVNNEGLNFTQTRFNE